MEKDQLIMMQTWWREVSFVLCEDLWPQVRDHVDVETYTQTVMLLGEGEGQGKLFE